MWVKTCDIKQSANALMWPLRPCISARLYMKTLRGDCRTLFALMSYSTNTISWSAHPIGGILLTLVTGVGLFVSRMSRVLSCHVGISITWERQCSLTISTKWDCICLLGIPSQYPHNLSTLLWGHRNFCTAFRQICLKWLILSQVN